MRVLSVSALADVTAGTYAHGTALSRALGRTRVAAVRVTHAHMTKSNERRFARALLSRGMQRCMRHTAMPQPEHAAVWSDMPLSWRMSSHATCLPVTRTDPAQPDRRVGSRVPILRVCASCVGGHGDPLIKGPRRALVGFLREPYGSCPCQCPAVPRPGSGRYTAAPDPD